VFRKPTLHVAASIDRRSDNDDDDDFVAAAAAAVLSDVLVHFRDAFASTYVHRLIAA